MPLSRRSFLAAAISLPAVSALPAIGCAEPSYFAGLVVTDITGLADYCPDRLRRRWVVLETIFAEADAAIAALQAETVKSDRLGSTLTRLDD